MASGAEKKSFDVALTGIKKRGLDVESVFVVGEPRRTILSTTVERGVDLIVMGTHGRRGLSHALLGSVAEAIVRLSPVPVLTVSGKDVGR
jgi:nucleotide-binding universal stress UspA family protein